MGLHKYQVKDLNTEQQKNDALQNAIFNREQHQHKTLGGYDGGVEVGFKGDWNEQALAAILDQLEHARKMAESEKCSRDECYIMLGDRVFLVEPQGCKVGRIYYRYIFTGQGVRFYLHHNPRGKLQPMRLRYNHDALVGQDLFQVHETTLDWFEQIGFHVTKETVSRIDFQVTLQRAISDFMALIGNKHAVMKSRKKEFYVNGNEAETFMAGTKAQICIYDKKQELANGGDEIKTRLVVKNMLDLDLPEETSMQNVELYLFEHLTRIEFRLRRDRLRQLGIDSIADLKEKELSLAAYMTEEWFRILAEPKIRGHENTQEVHEIWQEVQQLFRRYFPGDDAKRSEIKRGRDKSIKCTGEALLQQADGCLASYLAMTQGSNITEEQAVEILAEHIRNNAKEIVQRAAERAKELEVTRGFTPVQQAPNNATGTTDATKAGETLEAYDARSAMDDNNRVDVLQFFGITNRACG